MSLAHILTAAPLIVCPQSIIILLTSGFAAQFADLPYRHDDYKLKGVVVSVSISLI